MRLMPWLKHHFPRISDFVRNNRPSAKSHRARVAKQTIQDVFAEYYEQNEWRNSESISGNGSTLAATEPLRKKLPQVLSELGVKSLLDVPCGDFHWMRHVPLNLEMYIGGDIVPQLVSKLQAEYGGTTRRFVHINLIGDSLPNADAIFCRDCMIHLSNADVLGILKNVSKHEFKYVFASTYPTITLNTDTWTGSVRLLNLCLPPFGLPLPFRVLDDPAEGGFEERQLGVWEQRQLREVLFGVGKCGGA